MIYCFLLDTNPSMGEMTQPMSALDLCKSAIEQFLLKLRATGGHLEKTLLLMKTGERSSFESNNPCKGNDSSCLLSTLGDASSTFERAIKNIEPSKEPHDCSYSLTMALTLLNKYRMKSGVDHFGKGSLPWHLEPALIIFLTNGYSSLQNVSLTSPHPSLSL
jgi:hypothetical protein